LPPSKAGKSKLQEAPAANWVTPKAGVQPSKQAHLRVGREGMEPAAGDKPIRAAAARQQQQRAQEQGQAAQTAHHIGQLLNS
jgi:hypothetical protein